MTIFWSKYRSKFWKWQFFRGGNFKTSLRNGVLFVLACVPWVVRLQVKRASFAGVGGVLACVPWMGWVAHSRWWRTSVGSILILLLLLLLKYYPEEKKMLNVYFWKKKRKRKEMFQIDLNSNLKEALDLKSRCCFTLFGQLMQVSEYAWICWNIPECGQIFLDMFNFVNMPE